MGFLVGDKVRVKALCNLPVNASDGAKALSLQTWNVVRIGTDVGKNNREFLILNDPMGTPVWSTEVTLISIAVHKDELQVKGEPKMIKTITSDLKAFITDNKSVIYTVAVLFLMDHLLFQGTFRERLHSLMNKLLGKVESAVDGTLVEKKA